MLLPTARHDGRRSRTYRDDDVRNAMGELGASGPVFNLVVVSQVDARHVELKRLALRPVLEPAHRRRKLTREWLGPFPSALLQLLIFLYEVR